MKYNQFKIFKLEIISKSIAYMSHIILKAYKKLLNKIVIFFSSTKDFITFTIRKSFKLSINKLRDIFNFIDIRKFQLKSIYKIFDINNYKFFKIEKDTFREYKLYPLYFFVFILFSIIIFFSIPTFYKYDGAEITKLLCTNKNIECSIKGKVNYAFYPSPRIKIKNLVIKDKINNKKVLLTSKDTALKLNIKNILSKKKQNLRKVEINNFKVNFDFKNLKNSKNFFDNLTSFVPINFYKGDIILYDNKNDVGIIENVNLNFKLDKNLKKADLKGKFLDDDIYISLVQKSADKNLSTDFLFKMSELNFLAKGNFLNSKKNNSTTKGNIFLRKDKHKFTGNINYKDNQITISKSNVRSTFLDGKLEGVIKFVPYFDFNLDLNLKNINFTKLYSYFLSLEKDKQKKLFKISNKVNGNLILSSDKVYSSYNLVKSFESQIKFNNGNILIDQFLINLGKLGAADILGKFSNEKKFTNLKYESNIFIDNEKKFKSKFGIYNKNSLAPNLFVSGNFDLQNIKNSFYEISTNTKLKDNDINFIETEFNDFLLSNGYEDLFRFPKFKEFIKVITSEED